MQGCIVYNGSYYPPKMQEQVAWLVSLLEARHVKTQVLAGDLLMPKLGGISPMKLLDGEGQLTFLGLIQPCDFTIFLDKDTFLARLIEKAGIRVFNSAKSIALCDDKMRTMSALLEAGLEMPCSIPAPLVYSGCALQSEAFLRFVSDTLNFPLVAKENCGSYGKQVELINTYAKLQSYFAEHNHIPHHYQRFIGSSRGRDMRVCLVGGQVVASMLRTNALDFRANIASGGQMHNIDLPQSFAEVAIRASNALELDYCGVDILFGEDERPILGEVNSNAHFKNICDCTGIDVAARFVEYILEKIS